MGGEGIHVVTSCLRHLAARVSWSNVNKGKAVLFRGYRRTRKVEGKGRKGKQGRGGGGGEEDKERVDLRIKKGCKMEVDRYKESKIERRKGPIKKGGIRRDG